MEVQSQTAMLHGRITVGRVKLHCMEFKDVLQIGGGICKKIGFTCLIFHMPLVLL